MKIDEKKRLVVCVSLPCDIAKNNEKSAESCQNSHDLARLFALQYGGYIPDFALSANFYFRPVSIDTDLLYLAYTLISYFILFLYSIFL